MNICISSHTSSSIDTVLTAWRAGTSKQCPSVSEPRAGTAMYTCAAGGGKKTTSKKERKKKKNEDHDFFCRPQIR